MAAQAIRTIVVPPGAPAIVPGEDLLAALVYPCTVQEFMLQHYRQDCVAWKGGGVARVARVLEHLSGGRVSALVRDTASEEVHCWFASSLGDRVATRLDSIKLASPEQALTAHTAGASLYMRAPPAMHDAFLPSLTDSLGAAWAGYYDTAQQAPTGEIEVFVSRAGHKTGWHTDFMQNFTVQLRGQKRWRCAHSRVPGAPRGITPHFRIGPDVVEQQVKLQRLCDPDFVFDSAGPGGGSTSATTRTAVGVVELGPGDVFYFPAGMWHEVEALACPSGEDSLSVNFSLVSTTWADTAAAAVRHLLWRDDAWRGMVSVSPLGMLAAGAGPAAAVGGPTPRRRGAAADSSSGPNDGSVALASDAEPGLKRRRDVPTRAGAPAPGTSQLTEVKRGRPAVSGAAAAAYHQTLSAPTGTASASQPLSGAALAGIPLYALTGCHVVPVSEGLGGRPGGSANNIYAGLGAMLGRFQTAVMQLRPEHLLPPIAMVSTRFSDLRAFNDCWAVPRGFTLHLCNNVSVVTVLPEASWQALFGRREGTPGGGGGSRRQKMTQKQELAELDGNVPSEFEVNPLAVLFPCAALGSAADGVTQYGEEEEGENLSDCGSARSSGDGSLGDSSSADDGAPASGDPLVPPHYEAWIAHCNFGAHPDMASQARAVVHVPKPDAMERACGAPLRLSAVTASIARLTAGASGRAGEALSRVDSRQLLEAVGAYESARDSTGLVERAGSALRSLTAALTFVGVLCEGPRATTAGVPMLLQSSCTPASP